MLRRLAQGAVVLAVLALAPFAWRCDGPWFDEHVFLPQQFFIRASRESATFAGIAPSNTPPIVITAGLFTQFVVQPAAAPHANVPFNVVVTARDAFNNVLRDFLGQVNLQLDPGTGLFAAVPAPAGQHSFRVADAGSHTFVLQTAANGAGFRIAASDGNVQSNSAPFNVLPWGVGAAGAGASSSVHLSNG